MLRGYLNVRLVIGARYETRAQRFVPHTEDNEMHNQLDLLKRTLPFLETLHCEDAYGSHSQSIENCDCPLADLYSEIQEAINEDSHA